MANFNNMAFNRDVNRKRRDNEQQNFSGNFQQRNFENPQKKIRIDRSIKNPPSKVVHIRNVPCDMDDSSIAYLAVPFGFIDNIVIVRKHFQGLIQMRDLCDAVKMVDFFDNCFPSLHGKKLSVQYSKHQQLDSKHESISKIIQQSNEKREHYLNNWSENKNGASEILCILIDKAPNLIINHLVFYKIFSRFGNIMRIVSYTKKEQHFGLVEFDDPLPAHVAQLQLNNSRLLGDSGKMKIDFSKVPGPLQVERQSDKVRDYSMKPISKSDEHEMSGSNYDFPLFADTNPVLMGRETRGDDRNTIGDLINFADRHSLTSRYDDHRNLQFPSMNSHNGADLASAIRLMSYLNPTRNRNFRN